MKRKITKPKLIAGWREWAQLPEFGIDAIKVKIDTGAKTSSLHAFELSTLTYEQKECVRFDLHPIQDNDLITYTCICPIVDYRWITSSTGHAQQRFIISTTLKIGEFSSVIEISLANRDEMGFRMLIGRTAFTEGILITPKHSFLMSPKTMLTKK